jgi:hypothetical protein
MTALASPAIPRVRAALAPATDITERVNVLSCHTLNVLDSRTFVKGVKYIIPIHIRAR